MEQNNINIWNKIGMVGSGVGAFDDQETQKSLIYKGDSMSRTLQFRQTHNI